MSRRRGAGWGSRSVCLGVGFALVRCVPGAVGGQDSTEQHALVPDASSDGGTSVVGNPGAGAGNVPGGAGGGSTGGSVTVGDSGVASDATSMPPAVSVPIQVGALGTDIVKAEANMDSAILRLPVVTGAREYRAFVMGPGVTTSTDAMGRETVTGAVIYCAGYEQHNNNATAIPQVVQAIEVTDLHGPTEFIVEALDRPCPFPGLIDRVHKNFTVPDLQHEHTAAETHPFSFVTEDEVMAKYGSVILNGQGSAPVVAQAADPNPPVVVARGKVTVTPLGNGTPRTKTFFDDFSANDPPKIVKSTYKVSTTFGYLAQSLQNTKWNFFQYDTAVEDSNSVLLKGLIDVSRGQLHMLTPDLNQDVMALVSAIPKKAAHFSQAKYLHVTYEVAANSTNRRYPTVAICGADAAGQTFDANGVPKSEFMATPAFFQPQGQNSAEANWNCIQWLSRGGFPVSLGNPSTVVESNLWVFLSKAGAPPKESVIEISPEQTPGGWGTSWARQMVGGKLTTPVLDDQLHASPRTRFDVYLNRSRIVFYINGEQRVCNDFPKTPLTMAEGMVVFGNVLYHSLAERTELRETLVAPYTASGQIHILHNVPWSDERYWDNMGFDEDVPMPTGFSDANCYVAK